MRPAGRVREFFGALKDAARQWHGGRTFEMGAALAFYAVFAFAPLLVLAIAVAGLFLGKPAAEGEALHRLHTTLGPTVGGAIEGLLRDEPTGRGSFPTCMCLVVLVIGCMGFFGQLQQSLNAIWRVRPKAGRGVWGVVRDRLWAFLLTLGVGALLLVFLMLRAALAVVDRLFPSLALPGGVYPWRALDWGVALGFFTVLFALVYKLLPDVRLTWEDVWAGAVLTAFCSCSATGSSPCTCGRSRPPRRTERPGRWWYSCSGSSIRRSSSCSAPSSRRRWHRGPAAPRS
jgi:membrane protein